MFQFSLLSLLFFVAALAGSAALTRFSIKLGIAGGCHSTAAMVAYLRYGQTRLPLQILIVSLTLYGSLLAGAAVDLGFPLNVLALQGIAMATGFLLGICCRWEAHALTLGCGTACLAYAATAMLMFALLPRPLVARMSLYTWTPVCIEVMFLMWTPVMFLLASFLGEMLRQR